MPKVRTRRIYPNWIYSARIDLGSMIRAKRKEQGITCVELAKRCNIDQSNMTRIEKGQCNVSLDILSLVVNELNCKLSLKDLLYESL